MCGIVGFIDALRAMNSETLHATAEAMARQILHRGPDDGGTFADAAAGVALGARRLSIIDLSPAGHQPMQSESGRSVIIFNGEIYNAEDMRQEYLARGLTFRGHSDTEVLLESCEAIGVEATLEKLLGMYAFAVYDRNTRTAALVRDRLGKKPLYIGCFGKTVMFASELRCLRKHPAFRAEIDPVGLSAFIRFGYVPSPLSIYRNVQQLPPGGLARVSAKADLEVGRYWRVDNVADAARTEGFAGSQEEAIEELDRLLRDAVRRRMVADVPLGAFLSGGIDSSTVVALMQAQSSRPVRTFSIGFNVEGYNEAHHARAVARHLGTDHEELYFSPQDALDLVPSIPEIFDEPFGDASQLPTYMVCKMARRQVTVALSGDGGDECFAGYERYSRIKRIMEIPSMTSRFAVGSCRLGHRVLDWRAFSLLRRRLSPVFRARAASWMAPLAKFADPCAFESIYRCFASAGLPAEEMLLHPHEQVPPIWQGSLAEHFPDAVARAQILDFLTYLPDDILTKVDRASMAVSLEVRAPMLDHRVVRFAWRLPEEMKMRGGDTKWVLKRVLDRYVPRPLVNRPKMGFGVPIDVWLRGPLRDWAEYLIGADRLAHEGLFRPEKVRSLWSRHQAGENWQYPLWCVLMFQAWKERWRY
jgi:asparagine synthase (glutamine-hydrolysing)